MRRPNWRYMLWLSILLLLVGACGKKVAPTPTPALTLTISTATVAMLSPQPTHTVTIFPTPQPTATATPTSVPTITPNVPVSAAPLATPRLAENTFIAPAVDIAVLLLRNATEFALTVRVAGMPEPINLLPGDYSEQQLPPGEYEVTAVIQNSGQELLSQTVTLENHTRLELLLTIPDSTLAFANATDVWLRVSLRDSSILYKIPPQTTSDAQVLAPGTYFYTVFGMANVDDATMSGEVTMEMGTAVTITLTMENVYSAGLIIQNDTQYALNVTLQSLADPISIPAFGSSPELDLFPGVYTYSAVTDDDAIAPFTGSVTLEAGFTHTLVLDLGDDRAEVNVINETACELSLTLMGPETLVTTIPANGSKLINVASGVYQYTVSAPACNAMSSGETEFSGQSDWFFSIGP